MERKDELEILIKELRHTVYNKADTVFGASGRTGIDELRLEIDILEKYVKEYYKILDPK